LHVFHLKNKNNRKYNREIGFFFGGRFNSHEYKFEEKIINERKNDQGYLLRTDYNCKSTENK